MLNISFYFSSYSKVSKVFSFPSYWITQIRTDIQRTRKRKKKETEILQNNYITAPLFFESPVKHWGIVGFDIPKKRLFYAEPTNCPQFIIEDRARDNFLSELLFHVPSLNVVSMTKIEKVKVTQQNDDWSCGIHCMMIQKSFSSGELLVEKISYSGMIDFKVNFIENILWYLQNGQKLDDDVTYS